jgi:mannose-6-phosphate isomerase-like protein (cupin superfamily)
MVSITGKVWGDTSVIIQNALVELHKINVKAGFRCSEHLHEHKWNGFYVESGVLEIHVRKNNYELTDVTVLRAGDFTSVRPGEYHFFVCTEACSALELYWPELLSEDIKRKNTGGPMVSNMPPIKKNPVAVPVPIDFEYDTGRVIPKYDPKAGYATLPQGKTIYASGIAPVMASDLSPSAQFDSMLFGSVTATVAPKSGLAESLRKLNDLPSIPKDITECVSICKLGDDGKCMGCGRSLEEIEMAGVAAGKAKKKKE